MQEVTLKKRLHSLNYKKICLSPVSITLIKSTERSEEKFSSREFSVFSADVFTFLMIRVRVLM